MRNALFEQVTHVPLIRVGPGHAAPGPGGEPGVARGRDAHVPGPRRARPQDAAEAPRHGPATSSPDRVVLSEYWDEEKRACSRAAVAGGRKIVANSDGTLALFGLGSDPGETHDLAARLPDETARLHSLLVRFVAGLQPPPPRESEVRNLDELRRRLRSLGYIQ